MTRRAHVIVLGNEKGGSGKSTVAMHIFAALARSGKRVGIIDLDVRQRSLTRYIENRVVWAKRKRLALTLPDLCPVAPSQQPNRAAKEKEELARFSDSMRTLCMRCDFVIIDTPGANTHLSRLGHSAADTLITPINDSMVDLDLLGIVDSETGAIAGPSIYSEMVWESRKLRARAELPPIDWLVLRNRISLIDARNKRRVGGLLSRLSRRLGFRTSPGFCERVIFRELFLSGLTMLDLSEDAGKIPLTMSHVAARREVLELVGDLDLPGLKRRRKTPAPADGEKASPACAPPAKRTA